MERQRSPELVRAGLWARPANPSPSGISPLTQRMPPKSLPLLPGPRHVLARPPRRASLLRHVGLRPVPAGPLLRLIYRQGLCWRAPECAPDATTSVCPACLSAPHRRGCLKTHGDSSDTTAATSLAQCRSPSCPFPRGSRHRKRPSCGPCDGFQRSTPRAALRTSPPRGAFTPRCGPFVPQGVRNAASSVHSSRVFDTHACARGWAPPAGTCPFRKEAVSPWVLADLQGLSQDSRASPSPRPYFSNFPGAGPAPAHSAPLAVTHDLKQES